MKNKWVEPDLRDEVVDYIRHWNNKTGYKKVKMVKKIGITPSKYYTWINRYGKINEHNGWIPRDFWLEDWEKEAIIDFAKDHTGNGYRRLTYMMLDEDKVAVSPSSVYRVLKPTGLLNSWKKNPSTKGNGFVQPLEPHEHWHIDMSYINIKGTFYYLCCILDGYSRYIVHWEIRESMTEKDIEIILERGREKFPNQTPRIISDNGPQFISGDFKTYIKISGMTHVKTSPYYPQSNGKLERLNKTIKHECIRPKTPLTIEDARDVVEEFVEHYNTERLHSSIDYIAPVDKLKGRAKQILKTRDDKLNKARETRKISRNKNNLLIGIKKGEKVETYKRLLVAGDL